MCQEKIVFADRHHSESFWHRGWKRLTAIAHTSVVISLTLSVLFVQIRIRRMKL